MERERQYFIEVSKERYQQFRQISTDRICSIKQALEDHLAISKPLDGKAKKKGGKQDV